MMLAASGLLPDGGGYEIRQGLEMGRPSRLSGRVEAAGGVPIRLPGRRTRAPDRPRHHRTCRLPRTACRLAVRGGEGLALPTTVYAHIGVPKTGTTYLQALLYANRGGVRAAGRDRASAGTGCTSTRPARSPAPGPGAPASIPTGRWARVVRAVEKVATPGAVFSSERYSLARLPGARTLVDTLRDSSGCRRGARGRHRSATWSPPSRRPGRSTSRTAAPGAGRSSVPRRSPDPDELRRRRRVRRRARRLARGAAAGAPARRHGAAAGQPARAALRALLLGARRRPGRHGHPGGSSAQHLARLRRHRDAAPGQRPRPAAAGRRPAERDQEVPRQRGAVPSRRADPAGALRRGPRPGPGGERLGRRAAAHRRPRRGGGPGRPARRAPRRPGVVRRAGRGPARRGAGGGDAAGGPVRRARHRRARRRRVASRKVTGLLGREG